MQKGYLTTKSTKGTKNEEIWDMGCEERQFYTLISL